MARCVLCRTVKNLVFIHIPLWESASKLFHHFPEIIKLAQKATQEDGTARLYWDYLGLQALERSASSMFLIQ